MKALKHSIFIFLISALVACQSLGIPTADTFNKKLLTGYSTVEIIGNTTNTLAQAGKISKQDATNVLEQASTAKVSLDVARSVHAENPDLGNQKLVASLTILKALQAYVGGVK